MYSGTFEECWRGSTKSVSGCSVLVGETTHLKVGNALTRGCRTHLKVLHALTPALSRGEREHERRS
jgi:hypothetical protein